MASREEVVQFLSLFHQKATVFGLVFRDDRGKNMQTLLELEITPDYIGGRLYFILSVVIISMGR